MRTDGAILQTVAGLSIGLGVGIIVLVWSETIPAASAGITDLRPWFEVYSTTIALLFLALAVICTLIHAVILDVGTNET